MTESTAKTEPDHYTAGEIVRSALWVGVAALGRRGLADRRIGKLQAEAVEREERERAAKAKAEPTT
ncbi:hypothetical protein ABZX88_34335 [Kitasatospora aureofaciens]|uniref:hypothetical protein n=1 Tax=Kitasatospora aureofaciens TaxID=1894 RepID=UPI00339EDCF6